LRSSPSSFPPSSPPVASSASLRTPLSSRQPPIGSSNRSEKSRPVSSFASRRRLSGVCTRSCGPAFSRDVPASLERQ
jgi:hypothetical protein